MPSRITDSQRKAASSVAAHISTLFVFNTFQDNGLSLDRQGMLDGESRVFVIQLQGLEHSLERTVTEFLLWNLIGFVESVGPAPMRCFVVLDEAHKLAFVPGSPAEKLLREVGRLFRGATAYPRGRGVWRDDERGGTLLTEEPIIIFSYVAEPDLTSNALSELYRIYGPTQVCKDNCA